ncbi:AAA domain-containing protein [Babesia gibsoni]|uniref:AAA domain-containing protein n=1 Tax=Babesia gibsoni TaxID=33632 RepID=A0AAD8PCP4_BABGI|nr:AAA domain-containing protein [Babesia gibsoni]
MNDEERQKKAIALSQQAVELDNAKRYREAFDCYLRALDQWALVCKYQKNPVLHERFLSKMKEYVERAEALKQMLNNQMIDCDANRYGQEGFGTEQVNILANVQRPKVKWSDIAGLDAAKESLQEAVLLPIRFPNLFTGALKPWRGILLYGPPGTGKTYLAQACATEIEATFISISSSDVMSKWQGESEKFIKSLFQVARERKPCVIFIDEIDSMCSSRNEGDNDSTRRVKTEFLVQMQGISDAAEGVLVLAATNLPWALDSAIIRRFERRIYIPLPDLTARKVLLNICLKDCNNELSDADLEEIARLTEGYSGSDLNVMVRDARMQPLRQCMEATHFKQVTSNSETYFVPCSPSDMDKTKRECNVMSIEPKKLLLPSLTRSDFLSILNKSKPSVAQADIAEYDNWTQKYGQQG